MKRALTSLVLPVTLFLSACGGITVQTNTLPAPARTDALPAASTLTNTPPPAATETVQSVEVTQPSSTAKSWKAVRDDRFGFGLALPCWWLVTPISPGGIGGVMTVKNYDEAYFNSNSSKGFWDWPNGALKLDVVVIEGQDPSKSDADAYMANEDPTQTGLVSAESQQTGGHTATVLTLANLINTTEPNSKIFIYRLAPDKLLLINPVPQNIVDTPDFQAILSSIVLSPDEQINLPAITPAPALIDATCAP
jgi:hypothetical protein